METKSAILCTTWVKRGVAAAVPDKVQLSPEELKNIIQETKTALDDLEEDSDSENEPSSSKVNEKKQVKVKKESNKDENDDTDEEEENVTIKNAGDQDEFNFENYDDESGNIHCYINNIADFEEDPLITVKDDDDNDSEKEDDIIKPNDNLVLMGHIEEDASILEIFVYNEEEGSFYCHHDILLPSQPLCLEWLNYDPSDAKPGNLCAIGDFTPIIKVWDLDLVDCLEPAFKLGRKENKKKKIKRIGHKKSVLDLSWNKNFTHILASGSVDKTVLLWDLENGTPVTKLSLFNDAVQTIQWHPINAHHLLTGSIDKFVRLHDFRTEEKFETLSWESPGEVERILWNNFDSNICFASTDNGFIQCIDVRKTIPLWKQNVHEGAITGLSMSSSCPGLLVTTSDDDTMKVWDVINLNEPQLIWEKKTNLGKILCLDSNPENPFVFSVGGDNKSNNYKIFDFSQITSVSERFNERELIKMESNETAKQDEEMMDVTEEIGQINLDLSAKKMRKKKKKGKNEN
ncbi:periodic tryptophan protein 1 homolog [Leptopilina boulardi]|uniref:periodic tryptophan protein 1 homolog n=1 Tax=Leptopilina boulardi TaxID=63433 RepID=UPI0021F5EA37|nr:periodic tryptophan protein 1 homolog [Leptopilina boulardi]